MHLLQKYHDDLPRDPTFAINIITWTYCNNYCILRELKETFQMGY